MRSRKSAYSRFQVTVPTIAPIIVFSAQANLYFSRYTHIIYIIITFISISLLYNIKPPRRRIRQLFLSSFVLRFLFFMRVYIMHHKSEPIASIPNALFCRHRICHYNLFHAIPHRRIILI